MIRPYRLLLSLLTAALLLNSCAKQEALPQAPTSLLNNGDMEMEPYQDWGAYLGKNPAANPTKYTVDYTTEAASSPTHSLKVSCDSFKTDSTYQYMQQFFYITSIKAGSRLTMKAKIKTVNIKGNGIAIAIGGNYLLNKQAKLAFYTATEGKTAIKGTSDFTEYTLTYDSFPANTNSVYVLLFFLPKTTGTVYYDDISLTVN